MKCWSLRKEGCRFVKVANLEKADKKPSNRLSGPECNCLGVESNFSLIVPSKMVKICTHRPINTDK